MTCFAASLVVILVSKIILTCISAVHIPRPLVQGLARFARGAEECEMTLAGLLTAKADAITAAENLKTQARLTADKVKADALNVTLTAKNAAQLAVFLGPTGDNTLLAVLDGAIVAYIAIYDPAEAAHVISYNAADAACVISISAAIAAYATAVAAVGQCVPSGY